MHLTPFLWLLVGVLLVTWGLSHGYQWLALRFHFLDHPNHRSAHENPTPTGGGVVMVLVFTAGFLGLPSGVDDSPLLYALPGLLMVALTGFVDDFRSLSVKVRMLIFLLSSFWCLVWIGFPVLALPGLTLDTGWVGLLLGTLYLTGVLNLYNFMDGIDGLAAGEAVFVAGTAWLIAAYSGSDPSSVLLLVVAVAGGFLIINWPGARLFMGDVGSSFLGMLLSALSLYLSEVGLWSWLILLGWFLSDSSLTLTLRWINGERIHEAHNLHAYQQMARNHGVPGTLGIIFTINAIWLFPLAFVANNYRDWGIVLLILAIVPLGFYQYRLGAGQRTRQQQLAVQQMAVKAGTEQ